MDIDENQLTLIDSREAIRALAGEPDRCHYCAFSSIQEGNANMADISIVQDHGLSPDMARAAAQQVADKIAGEYGLACRWEGDVLRFERSGVQGALTLEGQRAAMRIQLGFLMGAFAPTIEAKVKDSMRRVFAA
jgi:putative polyhydroxyalkanoate system protein